jgi:DNA primase
MVRRPAPPPGWRGARDYLLRRGLPEAEWARFGLGFAPESRSGLKDALVQRGARPADLVEAGLLIMPEGGGSPYDRFRNRLIFPIQDTRGRVVSFGGRALDPEAAAKYLNGPESPLFHKSRTLYGLPEARRLIGAASQGGEGSRLTVVEGYMDAIACHRAGVPAVAPMGTALTEEQMDILWRLDPEPVLCFDGDGAGRRAASNAIDRALPRLQPGRSFRFVALEGAKDPDDLLREQGPAALREAPGRRPPLRRDAVRARTGARAPRHARAQGRPQGPPARGRRRHRRQGPGRRLPHRAVRPLRRPFSPLVPQLRSEGRRRPPERLFRSRRGPRPPALERAGAHAPAHAGGP